MRFNRNTKHQFLKPKIKIKLANKPFLQTPQTKRKFSYPTTFQEHQIDLQ